MKTPHEGHIDVLFEAVRRDDVQAAVHHRVLVAHPDIVPGRGEERERRSSVWVKGHFYGEQGSEVSLGRRFVEV